MLLVAYLRQVRLWALPAGLIELVLTLEWASGTRMSGATLPAMTLEARAVMLTALLARRPSSSIAAFEQAVGR